MKLIYIKSTMEPKNYSTLRSLLKKERGEKIAPYVFKVTDSQSIKDYLDREKITYEVYQAETRENKKRSLSDDYQEPRKKKRSANED